MITSCRHLRDFFIWGPGVTDDSVAGLRNCRELVVLSVVGENVSGEAIIDAIAEAPNLQELMLDVEQVTPRALMQIAAIPALKVVNVQGSGLTLQAVEEFRRRRPDVRLRVDGKLKTSQTWESKQRWQT